MRTTEMIIINHPSKQPTVLLSISKISMRTNQRTKASSNIVIVWQMSWIFIVIRFSDSICYGFSTFIFPRAAAFPFALKTEKNQSFLLDSSFNYTLAEGKNVNKTEQKETDDKKRNIPGYSLSTFIHITHTQIFSRVCVFFCYLHSLLCSVSEKKGDLSVKWWKTSRVLSIVYISVHLMWQKKGWHEWSIPANIWTEDTHYTQWRQEKNTQRIHANIINYELKFRVIRKSVSIKCDIV